MDLTIQLMIQAIEKVPAFRSLAESSDFWKGVFTIGAGLAPATVAAIFSYFLPYIMRFLSQWSGALTKGQLDRDVISQLFFFLVVSDENLRCAARRADDTSSGNSWSSL